MSSARGGGARGRGRGAGGLNNAQRGQSSPRGRSFTNNNNATRGGMTTGGVFGQGARGNAARTPRGSIGANSNGFGRQQPATGPRSQGSWADRYQTLSKLRDNERAQAIRLGQIADPDKPRALADAVTLVGTCPDMCAEFERVQRVVQKDVWAEEVDPNNAASSSVDREPDEARMVKKFRRAAAGLEEQLPSDLRPPQVLKEACDYLFNNVIGSADALYTVHHFVWDRTRAIRNDFSIQQVTKVEDVRIAVDCYERIARFHILSLHQLAVQPKPYDKYDAQQEREQLDRTLLSLTQYYDDFHGQIDLPNETEFRTYSIIFQLQDPTPDLEDRVQSWPKDVLGSPRVQTALRLYAAASSTMDAQGPLKPLAEHALAQQDWGSFWSTIRSKKVSYLMACVAETYFSMVRRTALNTIWRSAGIQKTPTQDWTAEALRDIFAFDDEDQVFMFFEGFGFSFENCSDGSGQFLNLTSVRDRELPQPNSTTMRQMKSNVVENKRFGRAMPAIISGFTFQQALDAGMVDHEEIAEMMDDAFDGQEMDSMNDFDENGEPIDDGESLFLPEAKKPTATGTSELSKPGLNGGVNPSANPFKPGFGTSGGLNFGKPSGSTEPTASTNPFASGPVQPTANSNPFASFQSNPFGKPANGTAPPSDSTKPGGFSFATPSTEAPKLSGFSFANPSTTQPAPLSNTSPFDTSKPPAPGIHFGGIPPKTEAEAKKDPIDKPAFAFPSQPFSIAPKTQTSDGQNKPTLGGVFDFQKAEPQPAAPPPENKPPSAQISFQPPVAPSTTTQQAPAMSPPSNPTSQTAQPTASSPPSPTLNNQHIRKPSIQQTKPKHPSPLAKSFSAEEEEETPPPVFGSLSNNVQPTKDLFADRQAPRSLKPVPGVSRAQAPPPPPPVDRKAVTARIAREIFEAPDHGFFDQFIEYVVGKTVADAKKSVELARVNELADDFRHFTLAQRYVKFWREICWRKRQASQGRKRRERAQQRLKESQAQRRGELNLTNESVLGSSTATSVARALQTASRQDVRRSQNSRDQQKTSSQLIRPRETTPNKRPSSSHSLQASATTRMGHKRLKSTSHVDDGGRVSKTALSPTSPSVNDSFRRSSFLGFSLPSDAPKGGSTVKTDYFRLKARGLVDPGRGVKRRRGESMSRSVATSPTPSEPQLLIANSPEAPSSANKQSRTSTPRTNDEDEALFARLKAAREGLQESSAFMKAEIAKAQSPGAALGNSLSSNESPSLARARADARLRASQSNQADVPAYRLRESRFVPRQDYGKAIERSNELRASRSQESSRPESRVGQLEAAPAWDPALWDSRSPVQNDGRGPELMMSKPFEQATRSPPLPNELPTSFASQPFKAFANPPPAFGFESASQQTATPSFQTLPPATFPTSFGSQPVFGNGIVPETQDFSTQPAGIPDSLVTSFGQPQEMGDFTIQPEQVRSSLANSFGASQSGQPAPVASPFAQSPFGQPSFGDTQGSAFAGFGLNQQTTVPQATFPSTFNHISEPNSHLSSQIVSEAISVISEDNTSHENSQSMSFGAKYPYGDTEDDSAVPTESDGIDASFGHANPFAALQQEQEDSDSDAVEHDDDGEEERESWDVEEGESDEYDRAQSGRQYTDVGDEGVNGDIEDFDEEGSYSDEDEDAEDYDEEEESEGNEQFYGRPYGMQPAVPPPNEALQGVGGTEEDAIELSD